MQNGGLDDSDDDANEDGDPEFHGDVPSAADLLERELRKRKQTEDGDNKFASQKRKTGPVISRFKNMEEGNGSGEGANTNIKDGAVVGPVLPPDP